MLKIIHKPCAAPSWKSTFVALLNYLPEDTTDSHLCQHQIDSRQTREPTQ